MMVPSTSQFVSSLVEEIEPASGSQFVLSLMGGKMDVVSNKFDLCCRRKLYRVPSHLIPYLFAEQVRKVKFSH